MNSHKLALALRVFIVVAICSRSSYGPAQSSTAQTYPLITPEAYERILDLAFAHEQPSPKQLQYSMVLRFMTSTHAESEVVISVFTNGSIQENFWQISGQSAWNAANDYIQKNSGNTDVEQIAKLIQTQRRLISVRPDQVTLWYSDLLKSMRRSTAQLQEETALFKKTGETPVYLDGSTYELWLDQGLTNVHWTVMDEEVDDTNPTGHSAIARWMNEVRRYALERATK